MSRKLQTHYLFWRLNRYDHAHRSLRRHLSSACTVESISAYTGKEITWEEMMNSELYLGPKTYSFGPVPGIPEEIPLAGEENRQT